MSGCSASGLGDPRYLLEVHLCYVDESGSTGRDLHNQQQPVFVMAGLLVSDEKWRGTERMFRDRLKAALGADPGAGFELHAAELLSPSGDGPFTGLDRSARNELALSLLDIIEERSHQVLLQVVQKRTMSTADHPSKDYGFDWRHPWDIGLAMTLTMFEEYLRGPSTGRTSAGMVFIDHEDSYLELVRVRSKERREAGGWRQLKKVMEIGYSAVSHANSMIQLTDLVAFTMRKSIESQTDHGDGWTDDAHEFFASCRARVWPKVQYKNLSFNQLNVPVDLVTYMKDIRKTA